MQARADDPELSDLTDISESEEDEEAYFAGISQSGPLKTPLPRNAKEAFEGPESECWKPALQEELQNLIDNDVFEIVLIPKGVKPITSKMVF